MLKKKITHRVYTKEGMPIRVWSNTKTGTVLPSYWKQQAAFLAGPVVITKRMANRRQRAKVARMEYFARDKYIQNQARLAVA